jgi:hypothetical membrane protein
MARIRRMLTVVLAVTAVGGVAVSSARRWRANEELRGWAVVSSALSPLLLTVGWLVADAFQPASYSPMRQTVSVMAGHTGTDSWIMTWAMLLTGVGYIVTAAGMAALWLPARILLMLAGLCSIGIATSPEPITGPTAVHLAWTTLGAATIAAWPAMVGLRAPPQLAALRGRNSVIVTAAFAAMAGWVMFEIWFGHSLGLAERLTASIQSAWPFVVAVVWRRSDAARRPAAVTGTGWSAPDIAGPAVESVAQYDSQGARRG